MLGFYPLSTHPISQLADLATPYPPVTTTGADAGSDARRLTRHEKRRRRIHAQQMAQWAREFQALLDGPDATPEVAKVATAIVRGIETAPDPAALVRGAYAEFFAPLGGAIILPTDRGDVERDVQRQRQIADVARRLRQAVQDARDDEDDVIALLLMS